ncbi:uncharacterized protein LOC113892684 isoform X1 [Bos indicus x Bos taurus]|uniref:uncharacterized protein isoform X1 n=1 Tax=Bos taurus TaxID=9913 RepID=UPI000572B74C|nr:uncharacterized protein LOC104972499 isoform X1 [Bos taurus]XP_019816817.1 PREDICTED: uncharacterized protein LOC109559484 isoform X2 [Bos indicus]XP_027397659.1 uncharacterized protein LOC113892684 isoform X1 [Bos indicus x Bos taurus]
MVSGWEQVPGRAEWTQHWSHSWERQQQVGRKVRVGRAGALRGPPRSLVPSSMILGSRSHTVFPHQCTAPSPGGVGRSAAGLLAGDAWAAEPGISLQALTVSLLCCFLPVPTPHLCKSPGILLSPAVLRAKALDDEIDRAFPLQGCSTGTLNASLSLASQTPSPPGERTRWAVCWSASPCLVQAGWSPLTDGETKSWGGGNTNSRPPSLQQGELGPTPGGLLCPGSLNLDGPPLTELARTWRK